jgi:hypothetical protein
VVPQRGRNERRCLLALEGTRPCASLFSVAALFDGCWHPRDRHEGLRYLIEQLPRILFFAQRRCEKLDYLGLTHLHGQVSCRRVSRHLIILYPLSCPDQGEIGGSILLPLAVLHDFLAFFDKANHVPKSPGGADIH